MKNNERYQALTILLQLLQNNLSLSHAFTKTNELSSLTKEICFGVCRHYFRLTLIAERLVVKRPKSLDIWLILLIGLYQLAYLSKPDYVVVKETVALLDKINKSWAKGLINAVLRRFCREQQQIVGELQKNDNFVYGHPQWFVEKLKQDWPSRWQEILVANDQRPPMNLRVNVRQQSREAYLLRLQKAGIAASPLPFADAGIEIHEACDVHELPGFAAGDVSVQDVSAQRVISLLNLQPGLRVLDACCAPGGKTAHILEHQPNLQECVALDLDGKRLQRVHDNLSRLQLQATVIQGNALEPSEWWDGQLFDRILLDAPCSATGVIRRHPDIKLLRSESDVKDIQILQQKILTALWPLLRSQGLLIYATCSILKEENEYQIVEFIRNQANCAALVNHEIPSAHFTGQGWQILPGEGKGDGFFYSVLSKS